MSEYEYGASDIEAYEREIARLRSELAAAKAELDRLQDRSEPRQYDQAQQFYPVPSMIKIEYCEDASGLVAKGVRYFDIYPGREITTLTVRGLRTFLDRLPDPDAWVLICFHNEAHDRIILRPIDAIRVNGRSIHLNCPYNLTSYPEVMSSTERER